jgi:hypothetical protein
MATKAYEGPLAPLMTFNFYADHDFESSFSEYHDYVLANPNVVEMVVRAEVNGDTREFHRKAKRKSPQFDPALNAYTFPQEPASAIDFLLKASREGDISMDMKVKYKPFFPLLLEQLTSQAEELHNMARPKDEAAFRKTLRIKRKGKKLRVRYKTETRWLKNIPIQLFDHEVKTSVPSPWAKLAFSIDWTENRNEESERAIHTVLGADYSIFLDKCPETPDSEQLSDSAKIWFANIKMFLQNNTDLERGARFVAEIFNPIVKRFKDQWDLLDLRQMLRDDLDYWLVTANAWHQPRENGKGEAFQRILSEVFGAMAKKKPLASPIVIFRTIKDDKPALKNVINMTGWCLQWGLGHCGEHAAASFTFLRELDEKSGGKIGNIVFTGYANIDHAFVIYGLPVGSQIPTSIANKENKTGKINDPIRVFDLEEALTDNSPIMGYVIDPYLAPGQIDNNCSKLLERIQSKRLKKKGLNTHYLRYIAQYPREAPAKPFALDLLNI